LNEESFGKIKANRFATAICIGRQENNREQLT